jgi:hypothetical protein
MRQGLVGRLRRESHAKNVELALSVRENKAAEGFLCEREEKK